MQRFLRKTTLEFRPGDNLFINKLWNFVQALIEFSVITILRYWGHSLLAVISTNTKSLARSDLFSFNPWFFYNLFDFLNFFILEMLKFLNAFFNFGIHWWSCNLRSIDQIINGFYEKVDRLHWFIQKLKANQ